MDDVLEVEDDEEVEEEADAEVEKVLFDITDGKLGAAGTVQSELPVRYSPSPLAIISNDTQAQEAMNEEEERNFEQYQKQLNDLLST